MQEPVFREKSLKRISSPEELDDYMKVTSPSMWFVMAAIVLLLAAAIIWSFTGRIETTLDIAAQVENGHAEMEVPAEKIGKLTVGSEITAGSKIGQVSEIIKKDDGYLVLARIPKLEDGVHEVTLVTESIAPITFLTR